jgi:hypothetical protein
MVWETSSIEEYSRESAKFAVQFRERDRNYFGLGQSPLNPHCGVGAGQLIQQQLAEMSGKLGLTVGVCLRFGGSLSYIL